MFSKGNLVARPAKFLSLVSVIFFTMPVMTLLLAVPSIASAQFSLKINTGYSYLDVNPNDIPQPPTSFVIPASIPPGVTPSLNPSLITSLFPLVINPGIRPTAFSPTIDLATSITADDKDNSWGIGLGYKISPRFNIDLAYANMGKATLHINTTSTVPVVRTISGPTYSVFTNINQNIAIESELFTLSGSYHFKQIGNFQPYTTLNISRWFDEVNSSASVTTFSDSAITYISPFVPILPHEINYSLKQSGYSLGLSLGSEYLLGPAFSLYGEAAYHHDISERNISNLNFGLRYRF